MKTYEELSKEQLIEILHHKNKILKDVKYLFGAGETEVTMYDGLTYAEWMLLAEDLAIEDGFGIFGNRLDWYWDYENDAPHPIRW